MTAAGTPGQAAAGLPALVEIGPGSIGGQTVRTVDARQLYAFLGVAKDFTSWAKVQVKRARLVQGRDYEVFTQMGEKSGTGRPAVEYVLSLDAAKHISMLSGTEKGFEVRDYFIECERQAKAGPAMDAARLLNDPATLRQLLLGASDRQLALEGQVAALKPEADALRRLAAGAGSHCITDAAKLLQVRPKDLFTYLRRNGWLYRRAGSAEDRAYQAKISAGWLEHKTTTVGRTGQESRNFTQVRVTAAGLAILAQRMGGRS